LQRSPGTGRPALTQVPHKRDAVGLVEASRLHKLCQECRAGLARTGLARLEHIVGMSPSSSRSVRLRLHRALSSRVRQSCLCAARRGDYLARDTDSFTATLLQLIWGASVWHLCPAQASTCRGRARPCLDPAAGLALTGSPVTSSLTLVTSPLPRPPGGALGSGFLRLGSVSASKSHRRGGPSQSRCSCHQQRETATIAGQASACGNRASELGEVRGALGCQPRPGRLSPPRARVVSAPAPSAMSRAPSAYEDLRSWILRSSTDPTLGCAARPDQVREPEADPVEGQHKATTRMRYVMTTRVGFAHPQRRRLTGRQTRYAEARMPIAACSSLGTGGTGTPDLVGRGPGPLAPMRFCPAAGAD
jgi:hypothetical protein